MPTGSEILYQLLCQSAAQMGHIEKYHTLYHTVKEYGYYRKKANE
jgi:hypothetical protein